MRVAVCLVVSLLLPVAARAADAPAEEIKIAYVSMARALNEVDDGKAAKAKLKAEFDEKQKKLDAQQKELKTKADQFETQKGMMKPDVRLAKEDELKKQLADLQQTYMQMQQELMQNEQQLTQGIHEKLRNIIAKIGDRDAYSLVLDIGDSVLYYKRHRDITDDVIKEYNRQYGKK